MTPAQHLERARRTKHLSFGKLAALSGVAASTIHGMQHGGGEVDSWIAVLKSLRLEFFPPLPSSRKRLRTMLRSLPRTKIRKAILYSTPLEFTRAVLKAFGRQRFCLDAASPNPPCQPCKAWLDGLTDATCGLLALWFGDLVWLNCPWDNIPPWMDKALAEFHAGRVRCLCILLPSGSTGHSDKLEAAGAVRFELRERPKFGGFKGAPPLQCTLYVLGATEPELARLGECLPAHKRWVAYQKP